MSNLELSSKTVAELRKMAKEYGVTLGAGLQKAGIIAKLEAALGDEEPQAAPAQAAPVQAAPALSQAMSAPEAAKESAAEEKAPAPASAPAPAQSAPAAGQVQFRAAWHNPTTRYQGKPAYSAPRPSQGSWQSGTSRPMQQDMPPRIGGTVRPANYTPRFGPEAQEAQTQRQEENNAYRGYRPETPRPVYGQRPAYDGGRSNYEQRPADEQRPVYEQRPSYEQRNAYEPRQGYGARTGYEQRQGYESRGGYERQGGYEPGSYDSRDAYDNQSGRYEGGYQQRSYQSRGEYYNAELGTSNPAVSEMLAAGECSDGSGVLEMHPDGYGFLRSDYFLPSSKDIYISMAQIKRFGLRTGDKVTGKTRPQREGDKYTAMLYITDVNGVAPDEMNARTPFEELTPVYASRRISLDPADGERCDTVRLVDLIAPLGFGQRGLILCPPDCGKSELLRSMANVITDNYPGVHVMVLLVDECPEDVTLFREEARCQVLASTFDQPPESHLRLADMVLERAQRLVEQKQDVVLIVDSLTRLAKTFTSAAAQQGRSMPGMVNPSSLFRAKRLFGAARCMKEGGSLTVIGAMNVETGNKVDDSVVEEFKGTANMELYLDSSMMRTGVNPPINLASSGTRRAERLLSDEEQQNLRLLRSVVVSMSPSQSVPQLMSMIAKTASNKELLEKLKDWVELMKNGRPAGGQ